MTKKGVPWTPLHCGQRNNLQRKRAKLFQGNNFYVISISLKKLEGRNILRKFRWEEQNKKNCWPNDKKAPGN